MRNILWVAGWAAAAFVAYKILGAKEAAMSGARIATGVPPVVELAHKLEDAWADHHTRA
jgi:hypothetical protein